MPVAVSEVCWAILPDDIRALYKKKQAMACSLRHALIHALDGLAPSSYQINTEGKVKGVFLKDFGEINLSRLQDNLQAASGTTSTVVWQPPVSRYISIPFQTYSKKKDKRARKQSQPAPQSVVTVRDNLASEHRQREAAHIDQVASQFSTCVAQATALIQTGMNRRHALDNFTYQQLRNSLRMCCGVCHDPMNLLLKIEDDNSLQCQQCERYFHYSCVSGYLEERMAYPASNRADKQKISICDDCKAINGNDECFHRTPPTETTQAADCGRSIKDGPSMLCYFCSNWFCPDHIADTVFDTGTDMLKRPSRRVPVCVNCFPRIQRGQRQFNGEYTNAARAITEPLTLADDEARDDVSIREEVSDEEDDQE
ncbi:hypothetical protein J8273_0915 [Carpediemonas membranifera]|nr:hypothetical protein J8273_6009 [Carpediemonas membranifera]KAG9397420.1 hypothetical protein J8273_0915 [Carpediemonas membranifera]|eukprot:KAG9392647.1 hypothetical protein J8273_6009 [Carpediemonas membranifera]